MASLESLTAEVVDRGMTLAVSIAQGPTANHQDEHGAVERLRVDKPAFSGVVDRSSLSLVMEEVRGILGCRPARSSE